MVWNGGRLVVCLALVALALQSGDAGVLRSADISLQPAEELGDYFEGDIELSPAQEAALIASKRNGLIAVTYRWPNNVVPYTIEEEYFTPEQIAHIHQGLRIIETQSCLKFVTRTSEPDFIRVWGGSTGCSSSVGHRGGQQNLHLAPAAPDTGCFRLGTIVHEFIHALGFYHQQSASDRDDFVEIVWDNIEEGKEHNFEIRDSDTVTDFNVAYDYGSVMHYSSTAFSKNGQKTIVPKDTDATIGQRLGMSERDISKINLMYRCMNKN